MNYINNADNVIVKRYKSLMLKKRRNEQKSYIIEGWKFVKEAILENVKIKSIVMSNEFVNRNQEFIKDIEKSTDDLYVIKDSLVSKIAETKNPQGILAEVNFDNKEFDENKIYNYNCSIILDELQDPGNMGTIIRSADAFNIDAIFLTKGCVDIYNPKVLRSTMGSIFRIPIFYIDNNIDFINKLKWNNVTVYSTGLNGAIFKCEEIFKNKVAFIIGNEARGVSDELKNSTEYTLKIDMNKKVDSLNASIAASIIMYEYSKRI